MSRNIQRELAGHALMRIGEKMMSWLSVYGGTLSPVEDARYRKAFGGVLDVLDGLGETDSRAAARDHAKAGQTET